MIEILVVEDDLELLNLFKTVLENEGYIVHKASNGEEAIYLLDNKSFHLIITDVMMPKVDGYELVEYLRSIDDDIPILFISALGNYIDKRKGFKLGIDDYMVKPINVNEMILRVEALLRRSSTSKESTLTIGNTKLNKDTLSVSYKNKTVELPNKEFQLLFMFLFSVGKIFTRIQIFETIWGHDSETDLHTLDVHINRLRTKFKDNEDFKILTVRGLGYKAVNCHEEKN